VCVKMFRNYSQIMHHFRPKNKMSFCSCIGHYQLSVGTFGKDLCDIVLLLHHIFLALAIYLRAKPLRLSVVIK
jgi:hypothetical protein